MRRFFCVLLLCLNAPFALAALDLNTATVAELDALPGVGPGRAQAIVNYRTQSGPFRAVDDLLKVKGIGDKTLAELKPLVEVGSTPAVSPSVAGTVAPAEKSGGGGFPWWILIVAVALVVAAVFVFRRRATPGSARAPAQAAPAATPAPAQTSAQASGAAAPPRAPASPPPPRPAGSSHASPGGAAGTPPPRPAGAPPRPAGSAAPAQAATSSTDPSPAAPPKPAGAPPKPAGSR